MNRWGRVRIFLQVLFVSGVMTVSAKAQAQFKVPPEEQVPVRIGRSDVPEFPSGHVLRLTVWNVQKYNDERALDEVRKLSQDSDLMLLQESMMRGFYDEYFGQFHGLAWMAAISFLNKANLGTGVSTGSRVQSSYESYVRSSAREPIVNTPKMIVLTKYPLALRAPHLTRQELLVANIHGINFVGQSEFESQIEQLEMAVSEHRGPMIVAGDFNTHWPTRAVRLKAFAEKLNLDYVAMENQRYNRLILDHIFSRGLRQVEAKVLFDVDSSDHYPLYARLALP